MMQSWVMRRWRFRTYLLLLPVLVLFCMGLAVGGRTLAETVAPDVPHSERTVKVSKSLEEVGYVDTLVALSVHAPLREEIKYRLMPFYLVTGLCWLFGAVPGPRTMIMVGATVSTVFSLGHGSYPTILIYTVVSFIIWLVFLKVSAWGAMPVRGLAAVILLHGAYNAAQVTRSAYGF